MILLELFWNFLVIGAVSFGGGYGMISLVRETVLGHCWLTESEFLSFIAVSESTPGPLAVNMATFIGASQAGLAGSFVATAPSAPRWGWCCPPLSSFCSSRRRCTA